MNSNMLEKKIDINKLKDTLIDRLYLKDKVIGIIQYGSSLIENDIDKYSDVDILIVVNDKFYKESGRGKITLEGNTIEFFIKPEYEVYKELMDELDTLEVINRNRLLTGKILLDDEERRIEQLKKRALELDKMEFTKLCTLDIQKNGIGFYSRLKKLERKKNLKHKDFYFYYYIYVNELLEIYSHMNGIPIIVDKIYKALKDEKYRKNYYVYQIEDEICREGFIKIIEKPNIKKLEFLVRYIFKNYIIFDEDYRIYY